MEVVPFWFIVFIAGVFGAAVGSFLNVCIYRWPAEQSVIRPASRCPGCGHGLAWHDNFPVIGWLMLRGRCRYCANPISIQYPLIELTTALIWMAVAARYGFALEALRAAVFMSILLGIAMTDAREMVIPDQFSLGGTLIGLIFAAIPGEYPLRDALIGAAFGYLFLWMIKLAAEKALKKPALGVGDIHMMAFVGAFVGWQGALLTLMFGSMLGVVIGMPLTYVRGKLAPLATYLPLGTFLALGAAVTYFWGQALIDLYWGYVNGG